MKIIWGIRILHLRILTKLNNCVLSVMCPVLIKAIIHSEQGQCVSMSADTFHPESACLTGIQSQQAASRSYA